MLKRILQANSRKSFAFCLFEYLEIEDLPNQYFKRKELSQK